MILTQIHQLLFTKNQRQSMEIHNRLMIFSKIRKNKVKKMESQNNKIHRI